MMETNNNNTERNYILFEKEGKQIDFCLTNEPIKTISFLLNKDIVVEELKTNNDYSTQLTLDDFFNKDFFINNNGIGYIRLKQNDNPIEVLRKTFDILNHLTNINEYKKNWKPDLFLLKSTDSLLTDFCKDKVIEAIETYNNNKKELV